MEWISGSTDWMVSPRLVPIEHPCRNPPVGVWWCNAGVLAMWTWRQPKGKRIRMDPLLVCLMGVILMDYQYWLSCYIRMWVPVSECESPFGTEVDVRCPSPTRLCLVGPPRTLDHRKAFHVCRFNFHFRLFRVTDGNGCAMAVIEQWMSRSNECHRATGVAEQWMSKQRDVKAKGCQSKEMSKLRDVRLHFHIFDFQILRDFSHKNFVFTSSTFTFWGKSCTKASLSHLQLSLFEGLLARKLRFHIFNFHFLREVSHEMRFWEIADARNAAFCRTKRVLQDEWGSLSGGRFRNTFVWTGIILGSALQWNWQFRLHFHHLSFQNLKEASPESFVFTSSNFTFWGTSRTQASVSHL